MGLSAIYCKVSCEGDIFCRYDFHSKHFYIYETCYPEIELLYETLTKITTYTHYVTHIYTLFISLNLQIYKYNTRFSVNLQNCQSIMLFSANIRLFVQILSI